MSTHAPQLEQELNEQLEQDIRALLTRMQKHEIDPIGLGLYARGYAFQAWQQVQDQWGRAFSQAEITVHVQAKIKNMGETI